MEAILHHLKPLNYCNSGDFRIQGGAGFHPSTVLCWLCGVYVVCVFSLFLAFGMRRHSKKSEAKHFSDSPNRTTSKSLMLEVKWFTGA